jgi:hypothetical protein
MWFQLRVANINQALKIFLQYKGPLYVGGFVDIPHLRRGPINFEFRIRISALDRYGLKGKFYHFFQFTQARFKWSCRLRLEEPKL